MSTIFRDISAVDAMPSQMQTSGRLFGLGIGKTNFRSGLISQDNSRLNMQYGSSNNVDGLPDQRQRISSIRTTTTTTNLGMRSYGLQSRNLTTHSSVLQERSMLLNQEFKNKINNTSVISKPFWPAVRNTTLTTGLQMQDTVRYNDDDIDEGGFRRPSAVSRVIRGRNTTFSSRLFHNQNTERHYKDLSNINGFNVSHISRRDDVETLLESRLGLNGRNNGVDNQSMSGSVLSVVSMKAQFMNVLENLHHSILNIGPHVTAEAVRMEFDKAKQGLENISEMSFAASVKPSNAASVISQSSKYICPPIMESAASHTTTSVIDGGSLNLKTSKDLLKTLISNKFNSTHTEEKEKNTVISSSQNKESDNEENSSFVFKKPRPYNRKRKSIRAMKIKAPPVVKSTASKGGSKVINLQQWFPIAVGSDLAFCGVDENGATVKTEAVKKRLNNAKVELISGAECNLIGSPSPMVSVLPQKIAALLRNGLTDKWRVLQKELSNCQTNHGEAIKRKSKSPKVKTPPGKKNEKHTEVNVSKRKAKSPKVISTPKKRGKVSELHTRSGRTVKAPTMFWLATGSCEVTSSMDAQEVGTTVEEVQTKGKSRSSTEGASVKSKAKSPEKKSRKVSEASPKKKSRKVSEASPGKKSRKVNEASPERKSIKVNEATPEKKLRKVNEASPEKKSRKVSEATPEKKLRKVSEASPERKSRKVIEATPEKKSRKVSEASPEKKSRKVSEASPSKKARASPRKGRNIAAEEISFTKSKGKSSKVKNSPKQNKKKENKEEVKVHSSKETTKRQNKNWQGKRKREVTAEVDSVQSKKSKIEKKTEVEVESTVKSTETKNAKKAKKELTLSSRSPKPKRQRNPPQRKKETVRKKTVKKVTETENEVNETVEYEKNFEFKLDDIEIPEIANVSGNPQLSRSQLRLVSMETPPLKYFNSNLKLMRSVTPVHSPDWFTSQRTESEVRQFQRRREEAFKNRIKMNIQKTVVTEKTKNVQNRDVKRVMEWVAEKTVKSPQWNSKVLQYVIPSRKQMEEEANNDDEEDFESEFL